MEKEVAVMLIPVLFALMAAADPADAIPNQSIAATIMVELPGEPAAKAWIEGNKDAADAKRRVDGLLAEQKETIEDILHLIPAANVLYYLQRVFNGVAVRVPLEDVSVIAGLEGVKAVHDIPTIYPALTTSVPFIGTVAGWESCSGECNGAGVRVGVIDTGIDYIHGDFGGSGHVSEYLRNIPTIIEPEVGYPSLKVIGGYDFAGDLYDPESQSTASPSPDVDPMDMRYHGTHVASIIAGQGIRTAGNIYHGPYDGSVPFGEMELGPGVAPEAELVALKVFGNTGGTYLIPEAVEWAVDPDGDGDFSDRLDVLNLSITSSFGKTDSVDAAICSYAAQLGVVIVASAGNDADAAFIAGSPASSPWVISVAASCDDDPATAAELGIVMVPDMAADFTARGPNQEGAGYVLKPDVAAPGYAIYAANAWPYIENSLGVYMSGTSMAAPHVAGLAALLREKHPEWSAPEIKAAIVNSAVHDVYRNAGGAFARCAPSRVGAGRIDVGRAMRVPALAFNAARPELTGLTFSSFEVADRVEETQYVRVRNVGDAPVTFDAVVDAVVASPGVTVRLDAPDTGPIGAGESVEMAVTLEADARAMRRVLPADRSATQLNQPRSWFSSIEGNIEFRGQLDDTKLRVPFFAALRPVAAMAAASAELDVSHNYYGSLPLHGHGLGSRTSGAEEWVSLASPSELAWFDPAATGGELKYVGVTNNHREANRVVAETKITFALAAAEPWTRPTERYYMVRLDTDFDGMPDKSVFNHMYWDGKSDFVANDVYVSARGFWNSMYQGFYPGPPINQVPFDRYDTALFNSSAMTLSFSAHSLGLEQNGPTQFNFWVEVFASDASFASGLPDMVTDTCFYDMTKRGLDFQSNGAPAGLIYDLDGEALNYAYHPDEYALNGSKGLLLLHHLNTPAAQAEWIKLLTAGDTDTDGIPDTVEGGEDRDNDGIPNMLDEDSDGDTIADKVEGTNDLDRDSIPNFLDLDSDGDGIGDKQEGPTSDADRDGTLDAYDFDSDGDGLTDLEEGPGDPDGDKVANYLDLDSDGDTLPDWLEGRADLDEDGIPNYLDLESDGDGLDDVDEAGKYGTDPFNPDTDGDGRADGVEVAAGTDPVVAQPPDVPDAPYAGDGTAGEYVEVQWDAIPGKTEYLVYRADVEDSAKAVPVSGWISATAYRDYAATPAVHVPGWGCVGAHDDPVYSYYWLQARNPGGESLLSAPDRGYRGH